MYESYSHQALPEKSYRELLGTAICVFNSNNGFIIENILNHDKANSYTWYDLTDKMSGELQPVVKETITRVSKNTKIAQLFGELIGKRNRIIHSFQITDDKSNQILATKDNKNNQFHITKDYLLDFIKENDNLSQLLHDFRGH